jgi:hypothetical protein
MEANCKLLLNVVGMAGLLAVRSFAALGQTQFSGIMTLELSDPGGASEPWRVQRQLLGRSSPTGLFVHLLKQAGLGRTTCS